MNHLEKKFAAMGARVQVDKLDAGDGPLVVNIGEDKGGQFFQVDVNPGLEVEVVVQDIEKKVRHLLLVARFNSEESFRRRGKKEAISILCGHDEREWFAARLGENACSVQDALDKLKPAEVVSSQQEQKVKRKNWNKRKNKGFLRQGEFFFIKENVEVDENVILKNEPLLMGGGTPHMAQFAYQSGGETVYVCGKYPNGVTAGEYKHIMESDAEAKKINWRTMTRDATLYVKGQIRHPDHATLNLKGWHRVVVNGELRGREVAFLD